MAILKPFAALRPRPELAARICELPYDVVSSDEARERAAGNPFSFFRISKPEIDLPALLDPHDPQVYEKGKRNFDRFIREGWLVQDSRAGFHLYRQVMGSHSQVGLVAVASCEDYLRNLIRKHELTRPDKEDDRVRHIDTLNAQTGPAFFVYRAEPTLDELVPHQITRAPAVDFTAGDGVRHTAWVIDNPADIESIQRAFAGVRYLYIADGHHRSAAAARVYQRRQGAGNSAYFLAVIFAHHQVQILPYNRVIKDLNGLTPDALLEQLDAIFTVDFNGAPRPAQPHEVGFCLNGRWNTLRFRPHLTTTRDPIGRLDATLLQKHVLAPIFGIEDPRTSERLDFVGGIRGTAELEQRIRSGRDACAFSMFPTSLEDLMAVADAGGIMPPKSTWFEPKLRDAMFCHLI